jgi:hypothetical protein
VSQVTPRERAWNDIHDLLPELVAGRSGDVRSRAASLVREGTELLSAGGLLRPPATISGQGEDEWRR